MCGQEGAALPSVVIVTFYWLFLLERPPILLEMQCYVLFPVEADTDTQCDAFSNECLPVIHVSLIES